MGIGVSFRGVYNLYENSFSFFKANKQRIEDEIEKFNGVDDPKLVEYFGDDAFKLKEDIELIHGAYESFTIDDYLNGTTAPVFFGSAVNNFGIKELLDTFIKIAPQPLPRETTMGQIKPDRDEFSGFIFKIHANLDPKHRNRIAFLRVCSGKFERNKFYHHVRLNRDIKFPNPASFMAQDKTTIDEAFPGDVIGLYDVGNFKIGDTITEGENFMYKGIPTFSPEIFKELHLEDPFKSKQLNKGILQLTDEGLAQVFIQNNGSRKVVGTVGDLQFDVLEYRLLNEYGAQCKFRPLNFYKACWVVYDKEEDISELMRIRSHNLFLDKHNKLVFLAESQYSIASAQEKNPKAKFLFSVEHNTQTHELEDEE
jgi:peptide chain release factor 3